MTDETEKKSKRGGWQNSDKYEHVKVHTEIEDDIPVPERIKIVGGFPFSSLQVGQSFAVDPKYKDVLQRRSSSYAKENNVVLLTRIVTNQKTGVKEVRCFRVK